MSLLEEWLSQAQAKQHFEHDGWRDRTEPLTADDALIIIDMQRDFVPKSIHNPNGGRFGVAEGDEIVAEICCLIKAASDVGATIIATRDYHPHGQHPVAIRATP